MVETRSGTPKSACAGSEGPQQQGRGGSLTESPPGPGVKEGAGVSSASLGQVEAGGGMESVGPRGLGPLPGRCGGVACVRTSTEWGQVTGKFTL